MVATLLLVTTGFGAFRHHETFDHPDGSEGEPTWFAESITWEVKDRVLTHAGGGRSFAVLEKAPHGQAVTVEATVTARQRQGTDWSVAGVAVRKDAANYWHLAIIEAPASRGHQHFVELCEMLDGTWLAQTATDNRLTPAASEGTDFDWQYAHPYRLRLQLTSEQIEGFVEELDGRQRAHIAFKLDNRAVTSGQPALDCANLVAAFDDVGVTVDDEAPAPKTAREPDPAYAVAACETIGGESTGFFYTKEIDGRWWLIDPKGRAFYMVGTDHIRYTGHWCQKLGYAPYGRNMEAKYGSEQKWAEATAERLAVWGFNTLPAGHSVSMRYRRFAHIEFLSFGDAFSAMDDLCPKTTWTGFPNVFSPKWARHSDKVARRQCAPNKEDPWLIGYFLDNELEWYGKNHKPWGLFDEAWKKPAGHSAKRAWIAFLREELGDPNVFESHWGVAVSSFDALADHTDPQAPLTDRAREVARRWVRRVAEAYFAVCEEAIRRYDPNHLVLGNRFAGSAPDIWDIAGRHCDIVSFNMYPRIDVDRGVPASVIETIEDWHQKAGKPMMITEWSFPALDSGLPCKHGAGMRVDTQEQRAWCFTQFQTAMFSFPFMVGSNFFMFVDEPALGIADTFPEDSNYGLVNEQDDPYRQLTDDATALNPRVYEIHARAQRPRAAEPLRLAPWVTELPDHPEATWDEPLRLSTGDLHLEGPVDGHGWRLWLGDALLGDIYPLLHQETTQDLWVPPDRACIVALRANDRITAIDMEFFREGSGQAITRVDDETGIPEAQEQGPKNFRCGWRFRVPVGPGGWVASQCLWVENTDSAPWRLAEVFHYLTPAIGGDGADDEPFNAGVPNYYRRGAAWADASAGLGVGCWFADDAFQCHYWRDPGGRHHADLRHTVDRELRPGQRLEVMGPTAFFFPFRDTTAAAFRMAADHVARAVLAHDP